MKRFTSYLLYTILLICSLCSCSYVEIEEQFKQKIAEEKVINEESDIKTNGDNNGIYPPSSATEEQIHKLGEKVVSTVGYGEDAVSMEYTVNNVKLYNSLKEATIDSDDTIISDEDLDIYNIREDKFANGWQLLVADVTIVNTDWKIENNENNIGWLGIAGKNDLIENISGIIYFSDHVELNERKTNYLHYILPIGETKTVKIGWFVNTGKVNFKDLYMCIGVSTNDEFKEFVSLFEEQ